MDIPCDDFGVNNFRANFVEWMMQNFPKAHNIEIELE
jgi:hypothetical protein